MADVLIKETILHELEDLKENQLPEVLDFIRLLKSRGGKERIILMDAADYRILRAIATYRMMPPHPSPLIEPTLESTGLSEEELKPEAEETADAQARWNRIIAAYLDGHINLGRAARLLDLPIEDLRERFLRLGAPLRLGPETMEEAQAEITVDLSIETP
jgi:predicted HTH domain antitoxin